MPPKQGAQPYTLTRVDQCVEPANGGLTRPIVLRAINRRTLNIAFTGPRGQAIVTCLGSAHSELPAAPHGYYRRNSNAEGTLLLSAAHPGLGQSGHVHHGGRFLVVARGQGEPIPHLPRFHVAWQAHC